MALLPLFRRSEQIVSPPHGVLDAHRGDILDELIKLRLRHVGANGAQPRGDVAPGALDSILPAFMAVTIHRPHFNCRRRADAIRDGACDGMAG